MGGDWENALLSLRAMEPFAVTSVVSIPGQTAQPVVIAGVGGGLLRSEDGGSSWNFIALPTPSPVVTGLAASAEVVYAATALDGVFLSKDSGKIWVRWNFGLLDWHVYAVVVVQGMDGSQTVCAGTESGVFYSINQGRTWLETDFPIDVGAVLALSTSPGLSDSLVIASTERGRMYLSLDQGRSWERCAEDEFDSEVYPVVLTGQLVVAECQGELLRSRDSGRHWQPWETNTAEQPVLTLAPVVEACGSSFKIYAVLGNRRIQLMDISA